MALLYASRNLEAVKEKLSNFDQQVGVQIVQSALKMPLKTIADNAGTALASPARLQRHQLNHCSLQNDTINPLQQQPADLHSLTDGR